MRTWTKVEIDKHKNTRWRLRSGYPFARDMQCVEVLITEVKALFSDYVIAFTKQDEKFLLVALLSLWDNENFYVNYQDKWLSAYVPAALRGHPFAIRKIGNDPNYHLHIDSDHLSDLDTDAILYNDDGSYSELVTQYVDFLGKCERDFILTQAATDSLQELGLIKHWNLQVNTGEDGQQLVDGLFCVDESALNELTAEGLLKLRNNSGLILAYAQLFSMTRLHQLTKRAELKLGEPAAIGGKGHTGEYLFSDDSGSLNFDSFESDPPQE